jgi:hypothetical protein
MGGMNMDTAMAMGMSSSEPDCLHHRFSHDV